MADFHDAMRNFSARMNRDLDQRLAIMRTEYDSLTPEDRAQFREWVARVAEIEDPMIPLAKSRIYLIPREMHDNPSVQISPKSLLRAIDAWDKGEEYLPSAIGDL